ncbi:Transposase DDE domain-containing protein [Streptomyces sp. KS_5]|nr:Transposase DDE domain-containing protein [Streptomyces sp. KS_5]
MERIRVPRIELGRPRTTPDSVSADKTYSNRRAAAATCGAKASATSFREERPGSEPRASPGPGRVRPPGFSTERCKKRNTVERAINKFKNYLVVSTRYDKRAYVYLGTVTDAVTIIWLRT